MTAYNLMTLNHKQEKYNLTMYM